MSTTKKVCLITGATGFVGLNLIEALVKTKNWRVLAVVRPGSERVSTLYDYLPKEVSSQIEIIQADLNNSGEYSLGQAVRDLPRLDIIFHLVHAKESIVHPGRIVAPAGLKPEGSREHIRLNLEAIEQVIQVAAEKCSDRVIFCSSWSSYGIQPPRTMVDETTRSLADKPIPLGFFGYNSQPIPYFAMKRRCELRLQEAVRAKEIKGGVILQPCSIFGPYSLDAWSTFFRRLLESNGKVPGLPGSSSFVDARDLAQAFVAAATKGEGNGEAYVIGGTNATNLTMLQTMAELVGVVGPKTASPAWLLMFLSRWNELWLHLLPLRALPYIQIKADSLSCPFLAAKLCQSQGTESRRAQEVLGYRSRPLYDILKGNYDWMVKIGALPSKK